MQFGKYWVRISPLCFGPQQIGAEYDGDVACSHLVDVAFQSKLGKKLYQVPSQTCISMLRS